MYDNYVLDVWMGAMQGERNVVVFNDGLVSFAIDKQGRVVVAMKPMAHELYDAMLRECAPYAMPGTLGEDKPRNGTWTITFQPN